MKKILVIGGNRFVGKKLVWNLLNEGYEVVIANRSGNSDFEKNVLNIIFDRNDKKSIKDKISKTDFDVIFDMICYSPQNAYDIINNISTEKYIMISSSVVYDWGLEHREEEFNPSNFEIFPGTIETLGKKFGYQYGYKIGKMGAEAVIAKNSKIPSLCVRFPIVIGSDDHTKRLDTYVEALINQESIYVNNLLSEISVVNANSAAKYLMLLMKSTELGTINIADSGTIRIKSLIEKIASLLSLQMIFSENGINGGYNNYFSNTFDLNKMINAKIIPDNIDDYFELFLNNLIKEKLTRIN